MHGQLDETDHRGQLVVEVVGDGRGHAAKALFLLQLPLAGLARGQGPARLPRPGAGDHQEEQQHQGHRAEQEAERLPGLAPEHGHVVTHGTAQHADGVPVYIREQANGGGSDHRGLPVPGRGQPVEQLPLRSLQLVAGQQFGPHPGPLGQENDVATGEKPAQEQQARRPPGGGTGRQRPGGEQEQAVLGGKEAVPGQGVFPHRLQAGEHGMGIADEGAQDHRPAHQRVMHAVPEAAAAGVVAGDQVDVALRREPGRVRQGAAGHTEPVVTGPIPGQPGQHLDLALQVGHRPVAVLHGLAFLDRPEGRVHHLQVDGHKDQGDQGAAADHFKDFPGMGGDQGTQGGKGHRSLRKGQETGPHHSRGEWSQPGGYDSDRPYPCQFPQGGITVAAHAAVSPARSGEACKPGVFC